MSGLQNAKADRFGLRLRVGCRLKVREGQWTSNMESIQFHKYGKFEGRERCTKGRRSARGLRNREKFRVPEETEAMKEAERRPLNASVPHRHSETLYQECLENGGSNGCEKLIDCTGKWNNKIIMKLREDF
jgi:hypothetical protein